MTFQLQKVDDYLQGVGQTEDELEGESRLINRQEPEDPGQPHEGGDPDGILEAFGDLLGAGYLLDLQETAHDQDEGDDVVEEDETDGDKEAEVQHKIGLQEATEKVKTDSLIRLRSGSRTRLGK